ncbi:bifunctional 4-hydroxy-2-oxoglutarate aldolase/2-dehydro-3-deoxy-phosphogluconate aldolase [Pedobacter ginsengisoli]|uniref:bifunctional 4-hydroxy-2-oxoglutarate aldolase/2-dehydro-3-deoxy-phosphogluconate aldolase n=1 Tax=Pedobacter ginsengisoli TaxID=363852 RepID=UPI0015624ABD|nr:bifunctional 4-hydroxy-2-oxoglutarate aldolase/2-dehydro-3-deoxy-phosphogluconate aldolase [Pedobacter ginsengisoli]
MNAITNTLEIIGNYPVIPVYYHEDKDTCINVLKASYAGGIRVFEFTNRGGNAPENFKALLEYRNANLPDLKLGIGTIKTVEQAQQYISIGADFIVSPIVKEDIAKLAFTNAILWVPGCMTPTEINFAEELGASLVKLFPGDTLGPSFLKAIKPLFPGLKFMPTGGVDVNKENIDSWLNAGVTALGFGSKLFQAPQDANDFSWLTERCASLLKLVNKG